MELCLCDKFIGTRDNNKPFAINVKVGEKTSNT